LLSKCPSIHRILAFEPNQDGYSFLKLNLARLPFPSEAIPKALADFKGYGDLEMPLTDIVYTVRDAPPDYAARFFKSSPQGPIPVTTIDSLEISPSESLVVKLDIEGGELAALRGAARTVQNASNIVRL
jgi:FkbM family methyltransferase